jgi:hypothetical protein
MQATGYFGIRKNINEKLKGTIIVLGFQKAIITRVSFPLPDMILSWKEVKAPRIQIRTEH